MDKEVEKKWMRRIREAPLQELHEMMVEGEAEYVSLREAEGARVAIPIPGAAYASTGLDHVDVESKRVS